jgi:hypothetical protein
MITIAEVIEQCAKACEEMGRAYAVRTLKQRYAGCIVAEGESLGDASLFRGHLVNCDIDADKLPLNGKPVSLYRAKEKGPLQTFLDAGREAGITHLGDLMEQEPTK